MKSMALNDTEKRKKQKGLGLQRSKKAGSSMEEREELRGSYRVIPGFHLSLGITLVFLAVLILIPLASILGYSLSLAPSQWLNILSASNVRNAFLTSIVCSLAAACINAVFGVMLAFVLVRFDFPGRKFLDAMIELPFVMPTAIAGITMSRMYSSAGLPGQILGRIGIKVSYTHLGIVVALVFVGIPFVVRAVQPVLEKLDPQYEEAADVMGAGKRMIFFRVILPEIMPALLTGFSLAFARGIGEYGSVIYISGNSARDHTQVISYVIMQKLNYLDYEGAAATSFVMLLISFAIIFMIGLFQLRQEKRTQGSQVYGKAQGHRQKPQGSGKILVIFMVCLVLLLLVLPLGYVLVGALRKGFAFYLAALSTETVQSAFGVTLLATGIAVVVNTFFGLWAAWLLTRFAFRGRQVLSTLIDIPFSVSPVIAGLSYIMMFGRSGWAAPFLDSVNKALGTDIRIVFALPGVVLATIFVTFPFVSREVIPVLEAAGTQEEETAAMMGAKGFTIFRRITLPHMRWALLYGVILCTARAMGEFGAVNALSKTRGETFTLPLEIDALYLSGTADSIVAAFAVSSILVILAIVILLIKTILEYRKKSIIN